VYLAEVPSDGGGVTESGSGDHFVVTGQLDARLPCRTGEADLWFAERPEQLGRAQALCRDCPVRRQCLAGALTRREPWGVWGGEIFERGRVVPFKRGRGRPAKEAARTVA
jgi:WhiB family redox-sensing transcriptional regulator